MRSSTASLGCLVLVACATAGGSDDGGSNGTGGAVNAGGVGTGSVSGTGSVPTTGGAGGSAGSGGNGGTSGAGGLGGGGGGGGLETVCGSTLPPIPEDVSLRGPWDVGVRTVTIGRLTVEIVYPAKPGTTAGVAEATYDIRDWLPVQEQSLVPDDASPAVGPIGGHLYRDVPIDDQAGPYPVIIFIHGTASFRIASGSLNVHWASRGFVVVAADYPGLFLADHLSATLECSYPQSGAQDITGDVNTQIQALTAASGDLSFLSGRIDMTRLALSGHSQGGCMAAQLTTIPNVQISIPLSGSNPATASSSLKSLMFIGGRNDTVIGYDTALIGNTVCGLAATSVSGAYTASPGPPSVTKRLVGIAGGGHLVPTDLCQENAYGRNAIEEAQLDGVCGINSAVVIGLPALFDCGTIDMVSGNQAVMYASTAALEETLYCRDRSAQFASLLTNLPQVNDFQHSP